MDEAWPGSEPDGWIGLCWQKWRYQKMELVMEIVSEPWAPPPFNLPVDLWILLGRPGSRDSESQPGQGPSREDGGVPAAARAGDARRRERAKGAMELVRQVILKEMDRLGPAVAG